MLIFWVSNSDALPFPEMEKMYSINTILIILQYTLHLNSYHLKNTDIPVIRNAKYISRETMGFTCKLRGPANGISLNR